MVPPEAGIKNAIKELRKGKTVNDPNTENSYNALNKYAINLNEKNAKMGNSIRS